MAGSMRRVGDTRNAALFFWSARCFVAAGHAQVWWMTKSVLAAGEQVERYEVEALLGRGAVAEVYRVRHRTLNTFHALKVLMTTSEYGASACSRRVRSKLRSGTRTC